MRHTSLYSHFSHFSLINEELAVDQHWFPDRLFNITELRLTDNIEMNKYWEITWQTCLFLCRFSAPFRNLAATWGLWFPVAMRGHPPCSSWWWSIHTPSSLKPSRSSDCTSLASLQYCQLAEGPSAFLHLNVNTQHSAILSRTTLSI